MRYLNSKILGLLSIMGLFLQKLNPFALTPEYKHENDRTGKYGTNAKKNRRIDKFNWGGTTTHPASQNPIYIPWIKQRPFQDRTFYLPHDKEYKKGKSGGLERNTIKVGRNEICPCGKVHSFIYTGFDGTEMKVNKQLKFKNCCLGKKVFLKQA